ncbi:MAG: flavin reductase family protein [Haliea sp.]
METIAKPQNSRSDGRALRQALGKFATGVAIVTTRDGEERDYGMTINSFTSVSLAPPLVLWSVSRSAPSYPVFTTTENFVISVLGEEQENISNRFAGSVADKFAGVRCGRSSMGPLFIDGALAVFECSVHERYEGGDHLILVGQVENYSCVNGRALVFHDGWYGTLQKAGAQ